MIRMSDGEPQPGMYRSPVRLYVNKDRSKIVPENSPEAAFVLCGQNGEIPLEVAAKYGLYPETAPAAEPEPEVTPPPAPATPSDEDTDSKAEQPKDDKAVKQPPANKGR